MNYQTFLIAVHKETRQTRFFGGKTIPRTNNKPTRFKYQWVNVSFESIEPAKVCTYTERGHHEQLQSALGDDWRVLTQFEAMQAIAYGADKAGFLECGQWEIASYSMSYENWRKDSQKER